MRRLLLVLALLASCLEASTASPQDLIDANKNQFKALEALIEKAELQATFNDGSLGHTYFLPLDHSFSWFKEYLPTLEDTQVADIVAAIQAADPAKAKKFVEQHIVHKALPNVDVLLKTIELDSAAGVLLLVEGDTSYVNVMEADGFSGAIAGPLAIPTGKSFVYVIADGLLADPAVVLGHGPLDAPNDGEEFDVVFEEAEGGGKSAAEPLAQPPAEPAAEEGAHQEL